MRSVDPKMELLKDLPSYKKENFSKFTQGACKGPMKAYVQVRGGGAEDRPQVIVTDNETLLHKELEMLALRTKRKALKRSSITKSNSSWNKHARVDYDLSMNDKELDSDNDAGSCSSSGESMT